ncbi:PilZ domain-containing protein [Bradyrhizobium sp. CB3481]|uniref:PilZ domain-containing protein n=1 Tax=Bradyrhizobium sp. CB3481 TaxID=3039158 RepID=UPI0024B04C0D|nr:PilZ domain-containing protein [Bradyrhizobium sp. CB3481]WFU17539.1 PilZ domain-containing protein [Bradyrhizobium sp. CB3481]
MDEHRTAPRRRFLKAGKMSFGGGAIDCTVRNLSETGAALEVSSPVGVPEHFTLLIEADHIHVPCRVVWRKDTRIGVHFDL